MPQAAVHVILAEIERLRAEFGVDPPCASLLDEARRELYRRMPENEGHSRDIVALHRRWAFDCLGAGMDRVGVLTICRVGFRKALLGNSFDFVPDDDHDSGRLGVVIEVMDRDCETVMDLCSWPHHFAPARPNYFATMFGRGSILGPWNITDRARIAAARGLFVARNPRAWISDGCLGVCLLGAHGIEVLANAPGHLIVTDEAHKRELSRPLREFCDPDAKIAVRARG